MRRAVAAALLEVPIIFLSLLGVTLGSLWRRLWWLAGPAALLLAWVCYFFRDPDRTPAANEEAWILAPADGRIRKIDVVEEPLFVQGKARRITIFLSILDVHVQRSPYRGAVKFMRYTPGGFAPAFLNRADTNETNLLGIETAHGPLAVTQMTGILARRIICWTGVGDTLEKGERFGLIKFGSRVDLYVPLDVDILARVGQQVYGGQTPLARWSNA